MVALEALKVARVAYESAFKSRGFDVDGMEDRLDDSDLQVSGSVFLASIDNQRFQISLDDEYGACAFAKVTGIDFEINLLKVLLAPGDLMINECAELFSAWVQHGAWGDPTVALISSFAHKSSVRRK